MRKQIVVSVILVYSLFFSIAISQAWAGQWIIGSVSIRDNNGQNVYGERLSVFLVSSENPVTAGKCLGETHPQRRLDCINNCHLDFYKRFQQSQQLPGYLIEQAVTSKTGNFIFFNAPPGIHYVLVKFPSMINGYKVAWQEPVTVTPGHSRFITLNDDNLLLPKNRRR